MNLNSTKTPNFKTRLNQLSSFLAPFEPLFNSEIITSYPMVPEFYPDSWLNALDNLTDFDLYLFDSKLTNKMTREGFKTLESNGLIDLTENITKLTALPKITSSKVNLPLSAWDNVNDKKRHEIEIIAPYISKFHKLHNFSHVVDIGGGIGHLSRILAHFLHLDSFSIDQNQRLQSVGEKKQLIYPLSDDAKSVKFINMTFGNNENGDTDLSQIFSKDAFAIGLHTCGALSSTLFQTAINNNILGFLNFGCCYYKMNPELDLYLSKFAQSLPFEITTFGLTLATRSHSQITHSAFEFKKRAKFYRYALHLFMYEKLKEKQFVSVGKTKPSLFQSDFATYAKEKMNALSISMKSIDSKSLNSFYNNSKVQQLINRMFLMDIIRWQFGRAIELVILLDRCIHLNEIGLSKVSINEYFDEQISPRNIGILGLNAVD